MSYLPESTKWLEGKGVVFTTRYIKKDTSIIEELKVWYKRSGLPQKSFFNFSGLKYKELTLKDKLPSMSEGEPLSLLASDGMLIKRLILVGDDFLLVHFREKKWNAMLGDRIPTE